ncbi:MAG: signal recognition particle-docking protein FtsY [Betaproteobacteria bacterium]|nr:signal recognition particle-docking protein FtsY [Betaproteobacteria bacterium]
MFGFFRRIKAALAPTPDAAQAPSVDAAQPPSANAAQPQTVNPAPQRTVDAAQPPSVDAKQPPSVDARHRPAEVQAFAEESTEAPAQVKPAERISWFARLKGGLAKTRNQLAELFGVVNVDEPLLEDLEAALIQADAGVAAAESLIGALRQAIKQDKLKDVEAVRYRLRDLIRDHLIPLEGGIDLDRSTPLVLMIAGVNGAGKTTSIGKLARHVQREGKTVLLAAGDTFRAAAREQLAIWGERNGVEVISQQGGDPAAVAFDAVSAGRARQSGVVMIDTAGRLPTQSHLMDELRKIRRVIGKAMSDAPHESLLILDGNTGQNMLHQVKAFDEAISLTGLVVTKLDGTAKGGALIALAYQLKQRPIPVYFIGVGEGLDDLQAFRAEEFANALLDC